GKSTFIVSLPKGWVTRMGLRAGSRLVIEERNGLLILTPEEQVKASAEPAEAVIRVSDGDEPDKVIREVISLYLVGYNYISVRAAAGRINTLHRNAIKELTRKKLVGAEIIYEAPDEVRLQVLLSYPELSVENALRRMCFIAVSMHDDAMQALKTLDKKLAREVVQLDDEVDRFSLYIIRQLKAAVQNEKILKDIGLSNPRDCLGYRIIVKFVERIADHAIKIAENIPAIEERLDAVAVQRLEEMSQFARSVFEDSIKALFKGDYLMAEEVISKSKTITRMEGEALRAVQKSQPRGLPAIRMIMESLRRTAEYASDIAEIVLNLNINKMIAPSL
ncbi:AbrB/MazE/SpoVT family DNA-binding domain-containing protein, partial [Candidatus Bathyarchaeota archaeon]|nr:AbrB/MazE/SpoVT family DNA-binding domain-containing protein [Candidatus Bathyarchaeota archaeon]